MVDLANLQIPICCNAPEPRQFVHWERSSERPRRALALQCLRTLRASPYRREPYRLAFRHRRGLRVEKYDDCDDIPSQA